MASHSRFDLGLSLNFTLKAMKTVLRAIAVWHRNFVSSRGPVTIINSMLWDNEVAIRVARGLLTLRDIHVLGKKKEHIAVEDFMALCVQCAASAANFGHLLVVNNQEGKN